MTRFQPEARQDKPLLSLPRGRYRGNWEIRKPGTLASKPRKAVTPLQSARFRPPPYRLPSLIAAEAAVSSGTASIIGRLL
jgi:hypothetical protein